MLSGSFNKILLFQPLNFIPLAAENFTLQHDIPIPAVPTEGGLGHGEQSHARA